MTSAVLSLQDVSVSLGGQPIVHDVTADIGAGEFVALLGSNGSGKTTLLRSVLGLVPHRGRIELFGEGLADFRAWPRLGYVPQHIDPAMLNSTVHEVVATGRLPRRRPFLPPTREDRAAVSCAIEQVGLGDRPRATIAHLSGGQRRRALIARALATNPDLLVMDEPLAGVDQDTQQALAGLLRDLTTARQLTVLVVLHEHGPFADMVQRTLLLQGGWLVYDGAGFELELPDEHHLPPEHVSASTSWVPSYPSGPNVVEED